MSASNMDTAELPRTGTAAPVSTVGHLEPLSAELRSAEPTPARVVLADELEMSAGPTAGRRALREERRQVRRRQQRYGVLGVSVLAVVFVLCIVVLGGVR
jgi:hypothetical protein